MILSQFQAISKLAHICFILYHLQQTDIVIVFIKMTGDAKFSW